jgi:hypothetical protein
MIEFEAEEYERPADLKILLTEAEKDEEIWIWKIFFRDAEKPWDADNWCFTSRHSRPTNISLDIWQQSQGIIRSVFEVLGPQEILAKAPKKVWELMNKKIEEWFADGSISGEEKNEPGKQIDATIWLIIGQMFAQIFYQLAVKFCLRDWFTKKNIPLDRQDETTDNIEFLDAGECYYNHTTSVNPRVPILIHYLENNFNQFIENRENYRNIARNAMLRLLGLFWEKLAKIPDGLEIPSKRGKK